ncbi:MAG: zinc ribbon domain-containing protein [Bacteroidaceae bacterium]|nr:zinc ribbon domain-containing protein [Bacteroidaceae bacterium]
MLRISLPLLLLMLSLVSCESPQPVTESRPYTVGYNFRVHSDCLLLQEDRPMHWCQGVAQSSDSIWVFHDNHLVVAAIIVIPEDCVDSVWVKVARDQVTMGWTHESDLLAAASPDDPISQFIRVFSGKHVYWFFIFIFAAILALAVSYLRHRRISLLHFHDIPSAYPMLLTSTLAIATTIYSYIQLYTPSDWVFFYFHPTLNPLVQPLALCLFLCCVWLLLLLTIAVMNTAFSLLRFGEAIVYLLTLLALCALLYLVLMFSAKWSLTLTYVLCGLYILLATIHYFRHVRAHYLCGRCGAKMRSKGRCPHCGAIND